MGIIDTLQSIKENVNNLGKNYRDSLAECFTEGNIPSLPLINPVTGEKLTCNTSVLEILDNPQQEPDNPSADRVEPVPVNYEPPDIVVEPETPNAPPTHQPPVKPDGRRFVPVPVPVSEPQQPPEIPPRRFSPNFSGNFTQVSGVRAFVRPTLSVEKSPLEREYGCLLYKPQSPAPARFTIFTPESSGDTFGAEQADKKAVNDFLIYQIEKIRGKRYDVSNSLEGNPLENTEGLQNTRIFSINILPNTGLSRTQDTKDVVTFSGNTLDSIADQFRISAKNAFQSVDGLAHVKFEAVDTSDNRSIPNVEDAKFDISHYPFFGGASLDECFIPLRTLRTNEPNQIRMVRQLQVIYSRPSTKEGVKEPEEKEITIPFPIPKEEIATEDIKDVFPETFNFGTLKVTTELNKQVDDINDEPIFVGRGKITFYAQDQNDAEAILDGAVELAEGEEINTTYPEQDLSPRSFSQAERGILTGEFKLDRAFYINFPQKSGIPPVCEYYNLRSTES